MGIWYSAPSKIVFPDTAVATQVVPQDRVILIRHRPTCGEADIENGASATQEPLENTRKDDTKHD